jgi:SnoaL-like domain
MGRATLFNLTQEVCMGTRIVVFAAFLFLSFVLMASPSTGAPPDDWVARMMADRSATESVDGPSIASSPSRPDDWAGRMIAARVFQPASPWDLLQIQQVEAAIAEAGSTKDLDLMVSLFARDARLISDGKTYAGREEIRRYWAHAGPFQPNNHWAGYSPAYKLRISVDSDIARMHFESLWVDVATNRVGAYVTSNGVLVRTGDRWVIKEMEAGAATGAWATVRQRIVGRAPRPFPIEEIRS